MRCELFAAALLTTGLAPSSAAALEPGQDNAWSCEDPLAELERARALADTDVAAALQIWQSIVTRCGEQQSLRALYNVAWAFRTLGDVNQARTVYSRFVTLAEPERGSSEDFDKFLLRAKAALGEIRATHGEVLLTGAPGKRVAVILDSQPARSAPLQWLLAPGSHRVELRVDGVAEPVQTLEVVAGGTYALSLPQEKVVVQSPRPPQPTSAPANYPVAAVAALWAAAGGLASAGLVANVMAGVYDGQAAELAVTPTPAQRLEYEQLAERNVQASVVAVIGYSAGGIMAAVATAVTLVELPSEVEVVWSPRWLGARVSF
jgi:hypothetical protein